MSVFGEGNWDWCRPDVDAIVQRRGLLSVAPVSREEVCGWLERHGYTIVRLHCATSFAAVLDQLNELFSWEMQFGYRLHEGRASLDALRDGFDFDVPVHGGVVLELMGVESLYAREPRWTAGMLSIASDHSLHQLAQGRRFFTLLVLEEQSNLPGTVVDQIAVPFAR